jgi:hypothetical protein
MNSKGVFQLHVCHEFSPRCSSQKIPGTAMPHISYPYQPAVEIRLALAEVFSKGSDGQATLTGRQKARRKGFDGSIKIEQGSARGRDTLHTIVILDIEGSGIKKETKHSRKSRKRVIIQAPNKTVHQSRMFEDRSLDHVSVLQRSHEHAVSD